MSKSKKHLRDCPALARPITSAECGAGRGSTYACPADCPFFPFTPDNYDLHGEIESRVIQKTYQRATRTMTPAERDRQLRALDEQEGDDILVNHARFAWLYHWERDARGLSFGERWLADPACGLSNDERVLLTGMNRSRPVVFEVHRILDEQTTEGVDLLDGRTLRIVDRSTASSVARYSTLLFWCYPMPHYERSSGGGLFIPEVQEVAPETVVREIIRHLGGPSDPVEERAWLAQNFALTCKALAAVKSARWQDTMQAIDARYSKTDYRVLKSARLAALLEKHPDLEPESVSDDEAVEGFAEGYVWLEHPPKEKAGQLALPLPTDPKVALGETVLGRVLLGRDRVRIEAMSAARHQDLRARFERLTPGCVEFLGERSDDLAAQTLDRQMTGFDPALVPPRLRENPQRIHFASQRVLPVEDSAEATLLATFQRQYATFLDEPTPWLNHSTPRAAAQDPALRPRLVSLMKTHICGCDTHRRTEGLDLDLNPLLAELGLHELISEPPPLGIADGDEFEEEDLDDDDDVLGALTALGTGLDPQPSIPALSARDMDRRIEAMQRDFPTHGAAEAALQTSFPGLLEFALEATRTALNDTDCTFLKLLILRAGHLFRPDIGPPSVLNHERIARGFVFEFATVSALLGKENPRHDAMERWLADGPQPVVLQDLAGVLIETTGKLRRKQRPSDQATLVILAFAKALVAELSRIRE